MLIKPPALRSGDVVGVAAPASPFSAEAFHRGIAELRTLGFAPRWDDGIFTRSRYVAGTQARRADELTRFFTDPAVRAIFCARGGYGSAQVIPRLDRALLTRDPKAIIGSSDVTSLLLFVTGCAGVAAFHGPMVAGQLAGEHGGYNRPSLLAALCDPAPRELETAGVEALRRGEATGVLVGGCLSQLAAAAGTPYGLRGTDLILFVEDVNERPYRIDRMLTQLRHAGTVAAVRGFVFGQMLNCRDRDEGTAEVRAAIAGVLDDFRGPIAFGLPAGHTDRPTLTLPFGVRCRLRCAADSVSLTLVEGAVAG